MPINFTKVKLSSASVADNMQHIINFGNEQAGNEQDGIESIYQQSQQHLPELICQDIAEITNDPVILRSLQCAYPHYDICPVDEMNELYVTNVQGQVAPESHIDGPFYLFPLCTLLKGVMVLKVTDDVEISTPFGGFKNM